ncbi:hypothetical protein TH24_19355 [Thalassospira xiamenensis]|nr:hypothetical protein TH24_19355 [Thalassospira xiamenensis]
MGADIGECPFDLSTVRHGVFIYNNYEQAEKNGPIRLHIGHADMARYPQSHLPERQKTSVQYAESG